MVSTFTANINLEEPARGDDVGTWDTPVNGNMTLADLVVGGSVTISGAAGSVVLAAAQFQAANITFNSTLLASIVVTFPSTFKKGYTIRNICTGSSAFTVTLQTTVAGSQVIACRPGNPFQCWNDGSNLYFVNLGTEIGGYWDYAGSSVPNWVSGCTVPPYLNCDASTFSATTYPALATILGSTTLPDSRGRTRAALDQGQARLSAVLTSSTVGASGGDQNLQSHTHANSLTNNNHTHNVTGPSWTGLTAGSGLTGGNGLTTPTTLTTGGPSVAPMTITNASFGSGAGQNVQPTYIGGLTMIRAA